MHASIFQFSLHGCKKEGGLLCRLAKTNLIQTYTVQITRLPLRLKRQDSCNTALALETFLLCMRSQGSEACKSSCIRHCKRQAQHL